MYYLDDAFSGGDSGEDTPVSIPNTEVKLSSADGTAWVTVWESRKLPGIKLTPSIAEGFFILQKSCLYAMYF